MLGHGGLDREMVDLSYIHELKEIRMKNTVVSILFSVLAFTANGNADCVKDQHGNVVCGKGQCVADQYGKVFCAAAAGGGAMKDEFAKVFCGVGYCAIDDMNHVWCSKEPGGAAAVDSYGKVKCMGGCEAGSANLCQEAK